jgi:hypothetical protein
VLITKFDMIRAAPWQVLGTSAAAVRLGARQEQWLRTRKSPQRYPLVFRIGCGTAKPSFSLSATDQDKDR